MTLQFKGTISDAKIANAFNIASGAAGF